MKLRIKISTYHNYTVDSTVTGPEKRFAVGLGLIKSAIIMAGGGTRYPLDDTCMLGLTNAAESGYSALLSGTTESRLISTSAMNDRFRVPFILRSTSGNILPFKLLGFDGYVGWRYLVNSAGLVDMSAMHIDNAAVMQSPWAPLVKPVTLGMTTAEIRGSSKIIDVLPPQEGWVNQSGEFKSYSYPSISPSQPPAGFVCDWTCSAAIRGKYVHGIRPMINMDLPTVYGNGHPVLGTNTNQFIIRAGADFQYDIEFERGGELISSDSIWLLTNSEVAPYGRSGGAANNLVMGSFVDATARTARASINADTDLAPDSAGSATNTRLAVNTEYFLRNYTSKAYTSTVGTRVVNLDGVDLGGNISSSYITTLYAI